jgi:hypothetical protein
MDNSPIQGPIGSEAPPTSTLSKVDEEWLDIHLKRIRKLITEEALRIARDRDAKAPEGLDVAEAAKRFAPGVRFPAEPSFWARTMASLNGVTVVSAVLALLFGIMGVLVGRGYLGAAGTTSGYFDITKLFAGAIVGSTSAGVLGARQKGGVDGAH